MASATGLFDQRALAWDPETLAAAGIDERQLFPLCDRGDGRRGLRAPWARRWPALAGATWFPALGDGATSTVGSDCLDPTRIALNVGTSAAMRFVAEEPLAAPRGLWSYRVDRRAGARGWRDLGGRQRLCLAPERLAASRRRRGRGRAGPDGARHARAHGAPLPRRRALAGLAQRAAGDDIRPLARHDGHRDRARRARGRGPAPGRGLRAARPPRRAAPHPHRLGGRPPLAGVGADDRRRARATAQPVVRGGGDESRVRTARAPVPGAPARSPRGPGAARRRPWSRILAGTPGTATRSAPAPSWMRRV